jgi:hypothetical protein
MATRRWPILSFAYNTIHAEKVPDLSRPTLLTNSEDVAIGVLLNRGGEACLPRLMIQKYLDEQRLFVVDEASVMTKDCKVPGQS